MNETRNYFSRANNPGAAETNVFPGHGGVDEITRKREFVIGTRHTTRGLNSLACAGTKPDTVRHCVRFIAAKIRDNLYKRRGFIRVPPVRAPTRRDRNDDKLVLTRR